MSEGKLTALICLFDICFTHSFSHRFHSLVSSHPQTWKQWDVLCNTESCDVSSSWVLNWCWTNFKKSVRSVLLLFCCASRERNNVCDMLQSTASLLLLLSFLKEGFALRFNESVAMCAGRNNRVLSLAEWKGFSAIHTNQSFNLLCSYFLVLSLSVLTVIFHSMPSWVFLLRVSAAQLQLEWSLWGISNSFTINDATFRGLSCFTAICAFLLF